MSSQALREFVNRHIGSTAILAALGAVLDAQATGTPLHPAIQVRIDELLEALKIDSITEGVNATDLRGMLAEIRFNVLLDAKLLFRSTRSLSWTHPEIEILQAGGEVSAGFAGALTHTIAPHLDGLSQHLGAANASFLDVGVGVAGLSVAMAHLWPSLNVVGIDPWAPSLALARENCTERWSHRPVLLLYSCGFGGHGSDLVAILLLTAANICVSFHVNEESRIRHPLARASAKGQVGCQIPAGWSACASLLCHREGSKSIRPRKRDRTLQGRIPSLRNHP